MFEYKFDFFKENDFRDIIVNYALSESSTSINFNLNINDELSKIRITLQENNSFFKKNPFSFSRKLDVKETDLTESVEISREEEGNVRLSEIIEMVDNQIISLYLIKSSTYDWKDLNDLCKLDFGRTTTFDGIKIADERAFVMKDCEMIKIGAIGCDHRKVVIQSVEERVMIENLFFSSDNYVHDFINLETSDERSKNEQNHSYRFTEFGKVSLELCDRLEPTSEFIKAVEDALNSKEAMKFKHITEKFGQFVPTKIILGGRAYYRESCRSECFKLIGGKQPVSLKDFNEKDWIKSLKDFRNWDCIEFQNPIGIFQLLPDNLRKQIISFLGKRILYSIIEDRDFQLEEIGYPKIIELNMPEFISEMIQDKETDCNIFATVVDKGSDFYNSNDDFFNCQVLHSPGADPRLIIHCIQKGVKKRKCKLKIGWMVIGYYKDLNLILTDFDVQLKIIETDFNDNAQVMYYKEYLNLEHDDDSLNKKIPCIGIPVIDRLDSSNRSLVIGHHFFDDQEGDRIGTFTFSYCSDKKHFDCLPKFNFYTLAILNHHPKNYGTLHFEQKPYIELDNSIKPKYISLFSTSEYNCGPIFLQHKSNRIEMKDVDCISQEQIECNFFDPYDSQAQRLAMNKNLYAA
ncbi:2803_t:CDS:2 [Funneliformis mosseae]|uniref:2803_t:CDS:1 n=1 Tax=Funneliformis mosseae TaxID=27381 RepID=A0A9N8ZEV2_FUNMO|nr:2803_t:CDS:2 [Funneliformis mosseae]